MATASAAVAAADGAADMTAAAGCATDVTAAAGATDVTAATTAAVTTAAATSVTAAAATATRQHQSSGQPRRSDAFLVVDMERRQADVGNFLLAENDCVASTE
jgi:hypothetical protein